VLEAKHLHDQHDERHVVAAPENAQQKQTGNRDKIRTTGALHRNTILQTHKKKKKKKKKKVEKQTTRENGWKSYAECAGVFPDETHHNHNQRGDIGAQQVRRTQADTAN
jgi:hypothetical protein